MCPRPMSLQTLFDQLEAASYQIDLDMYHLRSVILHIHIDGGAAAAVVAAAQQFEWTHGPKLLDIQVENQGLRRMWLQSLGAAAAAAGPDSLLVVFEDDMRVSPLYFRWLLNMIRKYGRNRNCRNAGLLGISLSPVKVEEMHKPFSEWHAPDVVKGSVYLSLVPSSWGSAYWSDRWSEFAEFVELRMQAPFYNITVEAMEKAGDVFLPHACPCVYWRCQLLKHSVSMML